MAITLTSIDPTEVGAKGGTLLTATGDFTGLLEEQFEIFVGPSGDTSDPKCWGGVPGDGALVRPISTTQIRGYLPNINPDDSPVDVLVRLADGSDSGILANSLSVYPPQYHTSVFAIRRLMPPKWYFGPRQYENLPPIASSDFAEPVGLMESWSEAIGEEDTAIGGLYMTRLTASVSAGATTFPIENALDWPTSGKVLVNNVVYRYENRTTTSLLTITHIYGGATIAGALVDHLELSMVVDISREQSALEQVRRAVFTRTSEGSDLDVVGRNLGVLRFPFLEDDDVFRGIIEALAYNPRGRIYGIELALDALVGAGNYEIYEDLIRVPCTIFIKLSGVAVATLESVGKAYLLGPQIDVHTGNTNTIDFSIFTPVWPDIVDRGHVRSVLLQDENFQTLVKAALPTAQTIEEWDGDSGVTAWALTGTEGPGNDFQLGTTAPDVDGYLEFSGIAAGSSYYRHWARVLPDSKARLTFTIKIPSAAVNSASPSGCFMIDDGARKICFGISTPSGNFAIGPVDPTAGPPPVFLGSTSTRARDTWYTYTLVKDGQNAVVLLENGVQIQSVAYTTFVASAVHRFEFGQYLAGAAYLMRTTSLWVWAHTEEDFWTGEELADADVVTADEITLTTPPPGGLDSGDVGKAFRTYGSAVTNPQGGNNNGRWVIVSVSGGDPTLDGPQQEGAIVDTANPTRITIPATTEPFVFPDDLGKEITISGSAAGNDGTYIIDKLLEQGSLLDFETFDSSPQFQDTTTVCEVVSATFTSETELSWKLTPVFVAETGMDWHMSDMCLVADVDELDITRHPLSVFGADPVRRTIAVWYSQVLSAQVLLDQNVGNLVIQTTPDVLFKYYPWYIHDPLGLVRAYLDDITAAGVIPDYMLE